jgi:hypothetical protein
MSPCPENQAGQVVPEAAHAIITAADVREIQQLAGHTFLTCDPEQEEEATWLAGCPLLPRPLLLREAYNGTDADNVAAQYQVSEPMAPLPPQHQRRTPPSPPRQRRQNDIGKGRAVACTPQWDRHVPAAGSRSPQK